MGLALATSLFSIARAAAATAPAQHFYLHAGDRVCFYGDSITEQRFYPAEVETYTLTRFPNLRVSFADSGVGGDRVTGGWAGPIDLRLRRDVFPFKPTVVTIMLGMNDAGYQPFNPKLFDIYQRGYRHIIHSLQRHLPGVRIVLLETSPYDDVTQSPKFPGGYNAVLDRYDAFVRQLARQNHLLCVDFNGPMLRVLRRAWKTHPHLAAQILPGRIHPSAAGEMMMALALLKAWGAPATVTRVGLDARSGRILLARNAEISELRRVHGGLNWKELDRALPLPVLALHEDWPQFPKWNLFLPPQPKPGYTSPAAALIDRLSGYTRQLDQERLRIKGLAAGHYNLKIDGQQVAMYSAGRLARGVNLARYFTPMLQQSYEVSNLVWEEIEARFVAWHSVQTPLQDFGWKKPGLPVNTENDPAAARAVAQAVAAMNRLQAAIRQRERLASQPHAHQFQLTAVR